MMRKAGLIILIAIWAIACTGKKDKNQSEAPLPDSEGKMMTYKYKVIGLQDSVISDSIWRIIFQVDGIDKLVLSKGDSSAIFTVDPGLVDDKLLVEEITRRGGVVLK